MTGSRKNASSTRGRPFKKGNPGRPQGSRNKVSLAVEALLEGEAEALTRKAIDKALDGDTTALRLCLERLCPPRKDRPIRITLPEFSGAARAVEVQATVVCAVAQGELTPSEGHALTDMLEAYRRAVETEELEGRITDLERRMEKR